MRKIFLYSCSIKKLNFKKKRKKIEILRIHFIKYIQWVPKKEFVISIFMFCTNY